ncbi:hypothetical protein [Clostridium uliginosum]|nr:hypothetical protein [Clostridium uliginosum]
MPRKQRENSFELKLKSVKLYIDDNIGSTISLFEEIYSVKKEF